MAPDSPHESILEFLNSAKRSRRAGTLSGRGHPLRLRIAHDKTEDDIFLRRSKVESVFSGLPQVPSGKECPDLGCPDHVRRIASTVVVVVCQRRDCASVRLVGNDCLVRSTCDDCLRSMSSLTSSDKKRCHNCLPDRTQWWEVTRATQRTYFNRKSEATG